MVESIPLPEPNDDQLDPLQVAMRLAGMPSAFVNDPPLILADEPTGSLDSRAGQVAIELLHRAACERGKAVLVVSHDPRIRPFADRVLAMEDGVLRAEPER